MLETLLTGVTSARDEIPSKPKLVLKLAPDLEDDQLVDIAQVIRNSNIDGVIISNTTTARPSTLRHREFAVVDKFKVSSYTLTSANKTETGGLSGTPVKEFSLRALKTLRKNLPSSIPLIGCGGISTGDDALEYAKAGASLVQVYTGFGYDGVGACRRIKDQITEKLATEGVSWSDIVSKAVSELSWKESSQPTTPETTVSQLTKEAEELKRLLNELGDRMGVVDPDSEVAAATLPVL